ncbi:TraR/DksA C4-type zinc finger protein [Pseudomonas sp. URMO17WK12:I12]|uniref:TraR/DksA C4-type zinc finger protein n=1 Tax=Pseudomonas sp. URMO17WK12:I12 TaxID=1259797 RepID=UPI000486D534|nr:TraR/DksA C4-type zinc finger protein [Pseudomonas sp. URMO17WK12:I12]
MADICDDADDVIEKTRQHALANIPRYTGISAFECEECGEDIPEDRREAVKGVKLCAPCGSLAELKAKGVRRA